MTILEQALYFLSLGIASIPQNRLKQCLVKWRRYQTTLPTELDIRQWFFSGQNNIAIVLGWRGLAVLDFDSLTEYRRWERWALRVGGVAAHVARYSYQVSTSRGLHVYLRLIDTIKSLHPAGVDILCKSHVVTGAGSTHKSGAQYKALRPIVLPMVKSLSDVLPASLLSSAPVDQDHVTVPAVIVGRSRVDPYLDAMSDERPSDDVVTQIRSAFRVEQFFTDAQKSGEHYSVTWCPFHDDDGTRSFWIDSQKQIVGCFRGCTSKPLDVINLYGRLHGLSNADAIRELARSL